MRYGLIVGGFLLFFYPVFSFGSDPLNAASKTDTEALDGEYWLVIKGRSPQGSSLLYSSGFVSGYDYAIHLMQSVVSSGEYDLAQLEAFMQTLAFPKEHTNGQIQILIDQFYSDPKNRRLPLSVAFMYARQVLDGYPPEYSRSYIDDMRKRYLQGQSPLSTTPR